MIRFSRIALAVCSAVLALALVMGDANARAGGGFSGGSRGMRTFSAPSMTTTAPRAAPIDRTMTQPGGFSSPGGGFFNRPGGLFGGGLFGGLAAGFLGAGLFGLLFGHGLFGGLGGFASLLGLMLQIGLVVMVARLAMAWWHRRNEPAMASGPSYRNTAGTGGFGFGGMGFGGGSGAAKSSAPSDDIGITPTDYDAFEHRLEDVQTAYGAEDLNALRTRVTPEMLSYFSEELSRNASRGVVNTLSDVKLLQGDLAEAWREGNTEYVTVAMRYSLVDRMVERTSGRVVEGSTEPQQVTEVWTFMRAHDGEWLLSAIQQA